MNDGFDPDEWQVPNAPSVSSLKKPKKQKNIFTKVPEDLWDNQLANVSRQTLRVAMWILRQRWKSKGTPFTLSNVALKGQGVSRWSKWRALGKLEELGLITVERRHGKSPVVHVIVDVSSKP
jgi:hypothetical protein